MQLTQVLWSGLVNAYFAFDARVQTLIAICCFGHQTKDRPPRWCYTAEPEGLHIVDEGLQSLAIGSSKLVLKGVECPDHVLSWQGRQGGCFSYKRPLTWSEARP